MKLKHYRDLADVLAVTRAATLIGLGISVAYLALTGCASRIVVKEQSAPAVVEPSARLTVEQWNALSPEAQAQIPADHRPL